MQALLEEFASRDGTDYGAVEASLEKNVAALAAQLDKGALVLLFDGDSEQWDLIEREAAQALLTEL
jgi:uncharacterized protein YheU (UPF0270 family)